MVGQTTLGIDITKERISVALVGQTKKGLELLRSGSAPTPENIIADGNIKNPQALAKLVKELCAKNKIPSCRAVVSLAVKPAVIRVMELPKDLPGNPAQFVQDELKHYPVMSGKKIMHDFCAIEPNKKTKASRLMCAASDEDKLTDLIKAFNRVGINIKAIEHPIISGARLVYAKHVAKKFNTNVLIAVAQNNTITLCVFSDANLDFIHSFEIPETNLENEEVVQNLLTEILAVKQFYDVEMEHASKLWETIIISGPQYNSAQLQQSLEANLGGMNIHLISFSKLQSETQLLISQEAHDASPVSIGLAMKYFKTALMRWEINLFPAGADEIHNVQKFALTTAAVAIIAFLMSLSAVPLLQHKTEQISQAVTGYKQKGPNQDTEKIISEMARINEKCNVLSEKIQALTTITESTDSVQNWAKLLADIGSRTPKTVRIVNLISKDNRSISLVGQASSYDTINKFVKLLGRSPYLNSVTLVKSELDPVTQNLLLYSISCTFAVKEKANAN